MRAEGSSHGLILAAAQLATKALAGGQVSR
jgi:hypothetical protein